MEQASSHEKWQKTDNFSKAENFLSCFIKAKNDLRIYPPSNPVVSESLDEALQSLKVGFDSDLVDVAVEKDRLLINQERIGASDPRVSKLSLALYRRGIRKIVIHPALTFDELRLLLDALNMKPEEIAEAGGIIALVQKRDIVHAAIESTSDLMIMDGANLPVSQDGMPDLSELEDIYDNLDAIDTPEGFSRMFVRTDDGEADGIKRLRKLFKNPHVFTGMLEKCALRIKKAEAEVDPAVRVQRMLDMLHALGTAIASLPSEEERSELMKSMAFSVLGLSADLRSELVNRGMMPKLVLKGVESNVLSRFPVTDLADTLLENFRISGGTATVMRGYLNSLDLNRSNKKELTETLRYSLRHIGRLTPQLEAVLMEEIVRVNEDGGEPVPYTAPDPRKARMDFDVPSIDGYPSETIQFQGDEKTELISRMSKELESPKAIEMAYSLSVLLQQEESPERHADLVKHFVSYIDEILEGRDYKNASDLISTLRDERDRKSTMFSPAELKSLDEAIARFSGEEGIRRVLKAFKNMKRESPEFKTLSEYFSSLGLPAVRALLHSLEDEQSRHVRLLTCQVLADLGPLGVEVVAEQVDHPQWFVARNAASILGQIGTVDCVPHLEKALSHPEPRVRRESLKGLASIKTDEAVKLICASVQESDIDISKAALGWVAIIQSPLALPALEGLLKDGFLWEADDEFVRLAIQALGSIPTDEATELLEKLSRTRRLIFGRKRAAFIREMAKFSLGKRKRT